MNELIKFKDEVMRLSDNEDCFMDAYYTLTLNCDIKLITDQLTKKQRQSFLTKCGLTSEEIEFYTYFDTNYQNTIEYIINYSKYDSMRYRIYAFLFSLFATQQICDVQYLLE